MRQLRARLLRAIEWVEARAVLLPALVLAGFYFVATATGSNTPGSNLFGYGLCLVLLALAAVQLKLVQKYAHVGATAFALLASLGSIFVSYFDPTEAENVDVFTGLVLLIALLGIGRFIFNVAGRHHERRQREHRRRRRAHKARASKARLHRERQLNRAREVQAAREAVRYLNTRLAHEQSTLNDELRRAHPRPRVIGPLGWVGAATLLGLAVLPWWPVRRTLRSTHGAGRNARHG